MSVNEHLESSARLVSESISAYFDLISDSALLKTESTNDQQVANFVVAPLGRPSLRGRVKLNIPDGQVGTASQKKRDCAYVTVDRRPMQPRPAQNPSCINIGSPLK